MGTARLSPLASRSIWDSALSSATEIQASHKLQNGLSIGVAQSTAHRHNFASGLCSLMSMVISVGGCERKSGMEAADTGERSATYQEWGIS